MTKSWEKYVSKNRYKNELLKIIYDIAENNLDSYIIVKLQWYEKHYRIRKGDIRIVFIKDEAWNEIVAVNTRGDIYKWL